MPARFRLSTLALLVSCNAILDNNPRELRPSSGGAGTSSGGAGGAGTSIEGGTAGEPLGGASGAAMGGGSGGSGGSAGASAGEAGSPASTGGAASSGGASDAGAGGEAGDVATSGLLLWFMADRGLTLTGELVSEWADQSPNHVRATQAGSGQMPKRILPATGPALLEFDGADDALKLPTGFAAFNGTSFFAVANASPAETCAGILSFSNGPDVDDIEFGRHHSNLLYYEVLGEFVEGATNAFEANRRLLVSITQSSGGATELRINGVLNASKTIKLPANIARTQNFLGRDVYSACPQSYKGQLGELILFNRAVTETERQKIQSYLAAKWAVAVE